MTVGVDPLGSGGRRVGQRSLHDRDRLSCSASCADGYDVGPAARVNALGDVHAEDLRGEWRGEILGDHGVQAGELLIFVVAVDNGLFNQRIELFVAWPPYRMRIATAAIATAATWPPDPRACTTRWFQDLPLMRGPGPPTRIP